MFNLLIVNFNILSDNSSTMEGENSFHQTLAQAIEKYEARLFQNEMRKLKEDFRVFHSAFQGFYNVLIRKSLIQEDPYKGEHKISEVEAPPSGPVMESEKVEIISRRLSLFDSQLDFLNNYYQFSTEFMTLERIKKLVGLITYIKWGSMSEASSNLNTRIIAELLSKMKQGADPMSSGIIGDAQRQLDKVSKNILANLKKLADYQRENYKFQVRENILLHMKLHPDSMRERRDDVLKAVRKHMAQKMGNIPFYKELVEEILDEESSPEANRLRQGVLEKLKIDEEKPKEKKEESFRSVLIDGFKILSSASVPLEQALRKLNTNSMVLEERQLTFGERILKWLNSLLQKEENQKVYEIELFDINTSASKTVKLDYTVFAGDVEKKVRFLSSAGNKVSNTYKKLDAAAEDKLYAWLSTAIEDINAILNKLPALDTYFKSEVPRAQRHMIKGIKVEISGIKNAVVKANQKKHEYVAKQEEREQLRKMGIEV